jgi:hypothetical protein
MRHGLILEILIGIDDIPKTLLNKLFRGIRINRLELIIHPHSNISIPPIDY